jgi:hypothetical protein
MCQYYLIYQKATEATSENTTARKPASFLALNSKSSGLATVKIDLFRSLPSLFFLYDRRRGSGGGCGGEEAADLLPLQKTQC